MAPPGIGPCRITYETKQNARVQLTGIPVRVFAGGRAAVSNSDQRHHRNEPTRANLSQSGPHRLRCPPVCSHECCWPPGAGETMRTTRCCSIRPRKGSQMRMRISAARLFRAGLVVMAIGIVARLLLFGTLHNIAGHLGIGKQSPVPTNIADSFVSIVVPLGVGLFCAAYVVASAQQGRHPTNPRALRPLSAAALARLGIGLIALAVIWRFTMTAAMDAYAQYVGPHADLQFGAASAITGTLNTLLLPLGIGFSCGACVVAALSAQPVRSEPWHVYPAQQPAPKRF